MRRGSIPVTPDPDQAHDWLSTELSGPAYAEAHATWFDRTAQAVADWFRDLFTTAVSGGTMGLLVVVIGIAIVIVIISAVLVWGTPRFRARASETPTGLFDPDDERSAHQLRSSSEQEAHQENWDAAVVLRMRAIARALRERGAVTTGPGATVHAFAVQASRAFPDHARELDDAAADFDDVRYLRRPADAAMFHRLRELDAALALARPVALAPFESLS